MLPRRPSIEGIDHPSVLDYDAVLRGAPVGRRVAIIGAGGVGFDVAEYLCAGESTASLDRAAFAREWGIDLAYRNRGGLGQPAAPAEPRRLWLLQRSPGKPGRRLGKTTGWIHRATLQRHGVQAWGGCEYQRIDDRGLHLRVDGESRLLEVDNLVICAGQESHRDGLDQFSERPVHLIGGALVAGEIDAVRAIDEGCRLAARL